MLTSYSRGGDKIIIIIIIIIIIRAWIKSIDIVIFTKFFTTADIVRCDWCIIEVLSLMDLVETWK